MVSLITQYVDACLDRTVADGISRSMLEVLQDRAGPAVTALRERLASGELVRFGLAARRDDLNRMSDLPILHGAAGRTLMVICDAEWLLIVQALRGLLEEREGPPVQVLSTDSLSTLHVHFAALDGPAAILVLTGSTPGPAIEAMTLAALNLDAVPVTLAGPADAAPLAEIVRQAGHEAVLLDDAPAGAAGFLGPGPALAGLAMGLDMRGLRVGASAQLDNLLGGDDDSSLTGGALIAGLAIERRLQRQLLLPGRGALAGLCGWWRDLTDQALGGGDLVADVLCGPGIDAATSVRTRHGFVTALSVAAPMAGPRFREPPPALDHLAGRSLHEVAQTAFRAGVEAIVAEDTPLRLIRAGAMDEKSLGALAMHAMLETHIAAWLLGGTGAEPYDVRMTNRTIRTYLAST